MKKPFPLLLLLLLCCSSKLQAQQDSIKKYVISALDVMKSNALHRSEINWPEVYTKTLEAAKDAKTLRMTYPAIQYALGQMKDAHSHFAPPEMVSSFYKRYRDQGFEFPNINFRMIDQQYAYLSIPAIGNLNDDDWNEYVGNFYAALEELSSQNPKGWIIDVRGNEGGMFTPMYAAIQPLLDHPQVVGSVNITNVSTFYTYKKGKVYFGKRLLYTFEAAPKIKHATKPIIILTDNKTASSGEFIVAAFKGQKNVTQIGRPTNGLTSDNQEYKLSDGAFLILTNGTLIDRSKKAYSTIGEGILPDDLLDPKTDVASEIETYYLQVAINTINQKTK